MNQPSGTLRSKDAVPAAFGVRAKNSMSDKDMVSLPASFFKSLRDSSIAPRRIANATFPRHP